ncbi:MAG TPA: tellurite resistance TerB family protein [Paracoccaceae bacterium]|nr:tellurite resistance TerB family protein [Paracoccaceae bacterium]
MKDARSLLDNLLGGAGGGVQGAAGQAREAWGRQSGMTKAAIAAGLLGVLLGGKDTRRLAGSALKIGGAAALGGLAYRAWQDWQAGRDPTATAPMALPAPDVVQGTAFLPADPAAAEDLSARLVRAMVAAVKADGHVTTQERRRIGEHIAGLGLGAETEALIAAELDAPLDPGRIAELARGPEEAAEIYAASLLVVDPEAPAEQGYLAMLAARLKLDPGLVAHLHARAAAG